MIKKLLTQKRRGFLCTPPVFILLAGTVIFAACGRQQPVKNVIEKTVPPVTKNITSSNAPKTIEITAASMPAVAVAGPPTTKPTGEGTGLGLSLSYDIIVKGHAGSIDVKSTPGEFAEFVISLPLV